MPEIFKNSVTRRAGDATSNTAASIGANATSITALTTTTGVSVGDLVDNQFFLNGTKVTTVNATDVDVDTASTNDTATINQQVSFPWSINTLYCNCKDNSNWWNFYE